MNSPKSEPVKLAQNVVGGELANPFEEVFRRLDPNAQSNVSLINDVIPDINRKAGTSMVLNSYPQASIGAKLPLGQNDTYLTIDPNYKPGVPDAEVARDAQKIIGQLRQENKAYGDMRVSVVSKDKERYLIIDVP